LTTISLAGWSLPADTESSEPIFSFFISASAQHGGGHFALTFGQCLGLVGESKLGVQILAGRLPSCRAVFMPLPTEAP
jgi:hypothetical protein